MAALLPCPSCARHARVSEPTCPFCATPFDDAFRTDEPRPRAPTGRLTRAALFAVGAGGLVAGTLSCASAESAYGGTPEGPFWDDASPLVDAATDAPEAAAVDATPEASTVADAGGADAGADAPTDPCGPENFCALYGGPAVGH
jgi:hypothetical protein